MEIETLLIQLYNMSEMTERKYTAVYTEKPRLPWRKTQVKTLEELGSSTAFKQIGSVRIAETGPKIKVIARLQDGAKILEDGKETEQIVATHYGKHWSKDLWPGQSVSLKRRGHLLQITASA